jgi:hypothetical protein
MPKTFTVRLPDDIAADAEALARAEGKSQRDGHSGLIEASNGAATTRSSRGPIKRI